MAAQAKVKAPEGAVKVKEADIQSFRSALRGDLIQPADRSTRARAGYTTR